MGPADTLGMGEQPKLRPCLRCGKMRKSTRENRIHDHCARAETVAYLDGGIGLTSAEHSRVSRILAASEEQAPRRRGRQPRPLPSQAEVATMTPAQKAVARRMFMQRTGRVPEWLAPVSRVEACRRGAAAVRAKAEAKPLPQSAEELMALPLSARHSAYVRFMRQGGRPAWWPKGWTSTKRAA